MSGILYFILAGLRFLLYSGWMDEELHRKGYVNGWVDGGTDIWMDSWKIYLTT